MLKQCKTPTLGLTDDDNVFKILIGGSALTTCQMQTFLRNEPLYSAILAAPLCVHLVQVCALVTALLALRVYATNA